MKNITLLILILLISPVTILSQSCLPEGIKFHTQSEIDSFRINFPDCTEIEGNVRIGYSSNNISNLIGLSGLTSFGGNLEISNLDSITNLTGLDSVTFIGGRLDIGRNWIPGNPSLINLTGLENLDSIGGSLSIWRNETLTSLSGLNNLVSIGGALDIEQNGLTSLSGLDNLSFIGGELTIRENYVLISITELKGLTSIGGDVQITSNNCLTSLTGLHNVTSIEGQLVIVFNHSLTNLSGLDNLSSIGGRLMIRRSDGLTSLSGLENLTSIKDQLEIGGYALGFGNPVLTSLEGLENLTSIGEDCEIRIGYNKILTSLSGLDNINPDSIGDLYIYYNDFLKECDVKSFCDFLSKSNRSIEIHDNAVGCNSEEDVLEACGLVSIEEYGQGNRISALPNPTCGISDIKYQVSIGKKVELCVFDINGQKIKTLVNKKQAVGDYTVRFDTSDLPAGIYIISLQAGEQVATTRLVVMR